jgi:hypothetical protein
MHWLARGPLFFLGHEREQAGRGRGSCKCFFLLFVSLVPIHSPFVLFVSNIVEAGLNVHGSLAETILLKSATREFLFQRMRLRVLFVLSARDTWDRMVVWNVPWRE